MPHQSKILLPCGPLAPVGPALLQLQRVQRACDGGEGGRCFGPLIVCYLRENGDLRTENPDLPSETGDMAGFNSAT